MVMLNLGDESPYKSDFFFSHSKERLGTSLVNRNMRIIYSSGLNKLEIHLGYTAENNSAASDSEACVQGNTPKWGYCQRISCKGTESSVYTEV